MHTRAEPRQLSTASWAEQIPAEQWRVYDKVLREAERRELRYALGGAYALAAYSGRFRNTKDIDLYVLPSDREAMIDVLLSCGLADYFSTLPYERHWIYRSHEGATIVDVIWGMANRRAPVDEWWLSRAPTIQLGDHRLRVLPIEELIWAKLYVIQKDRCDWPDILNLLQASACRLDWEHLMLRVADDLPLLAGVFAVFMWLRPECAATVPESVYTRLRSAVVRPQFLEMTVDLRADLLDTRKWLVPPAEEAPC